jgi:hypothetical protein
MLNLWKRYQIDLGIRNRIVGGVPTNPELIKGWIAANMPNVTAEDRAKLAEKTASELHVATEEKAEGMWTTFKRDEAGVYIEGRQVKAMFKECSNILRELLIKDEGKAARADAKAAGQDAPTKKSRFTNLKAKLAERLFVEEDRVYIERKGEKLAKPDGSEEKAIHVMTAQGERSALKRVDFVNAPATLRFTIRFLNDGLVDMDLVKTLLEFGGWNGLGADRSQGNGLFELVDAREIGGEIPSGKPHKTAPISSLG